MTKQEQCLAGMYVVADKLRQESDKEPKKHQVPKYGISNTYGWRKFLELARFVSDEEIEDELADGSLASAYSIKEKLFERKLVQRGDHYDIFYDLCLNDYWLWSLVKEAANVAHIKKCFPINIECFVEAISNLQAQIPQGKFLSMETTLIRTLSECTGTRDLVERSVYLKRQVEDAEIRSLAGFLRKKIGKEGYLEYLEHGLILVDDEYESDPLKADIRFNKLLLLDWQLGQRGPVYARHEGLQAQ